MAKRARKSADGDLLALCERWQALRLAPVTSPASCLAAPSETEQVLALIAAAMPLTTIGVAAMLTVADALPEARVLTASQIRAAAMRALQEREVYVGDPWGPNAPPPPLAPAEVDFKGAPYRHRGLLGDAFGLEKAKLDAIDDQNTVDMTKAAAEIADMFGLPAGRMRQQLEQRIGRYVTEAMKHRGAVVNGYVPLRASDVEPRLALLVKALSSCKREVYEMMFTGGGENDPPRVRHATRRAREKIEVAQVDRAARGCDKSDPARLLGEIDCLLAECDDALRSAARMPRRGRGKGGELEGIPWLDILASGLYLLLTGAGLRIKASKTRAKIDATRPRAYPSLVEVIAVVHKHLPADVRLDETEPLVRQRGLDDVFRLAAQHAVKENATPR